MPTPRRVLVDPNRPGVYHCISRCVRRALLCDGQFAHRKRWLQERLEFLSSLMAVDIYAFQILGNHIHVLVGIRPDTVAGWTDREVVRRYLKICPCRWKRVAKGLDPDGEPTDQEIELELSKPDRIVELRRRLSCLSWFNAKLKEPIARRANTEDGCKGRFWDGRFRSLAVLDQDALVTVAVYVDLNAVRAGVADRLEDIQHGSIGDRIAAALGRPSQISTPLASIPGFTDAQYVAEVDRWSRRRVPGKKAAKASLEPILDRLGLSTRQWLAALGRCWDDLRGTAIGGVSAMAAEVARRHARWICSPFDALE